MRQYALKLLMAIEPGLDLMVFQTLSVRLGLIVLPFTRDGICPLFFVIFSISNASRLTIDF